MRYKLRDNLYGFDIVSEVFNSRGIKSVEDLISPPIPKEIDLSKIYNIEEAIGMYIKHINNSRILLVVDTDVDGMTAASLFYQVSKIMKPYSDITLHIHPAKEHGLTSDVMNREDLEEYNLIVLPDAGTNEKVQIEKLMHKNIDVLILDHHEIEEELSFNNVVVVNNQREKCSINKNFSGVGVVYFFFKALVSKYNIPLNIDIFLDLVAVGTVADMMDVTDLEVRYYVEKGFNNIKNKFLQTYFSEKEMYYKTISWGVASLINAVIRYGSVEDKTELFLVLSNQNFYEKIKKNKKKKNKSTGKFDIIELEMSRYELALDLSSSIKDKQDRDVRNLTNQLIERYANQNIGIFVVGQDTKTINGLAANKIAEKIQKPVIILTEGENGFFTGSARGYEKYMADFKSWCEKTNLFNFTLGHSNSFGVSISETNLNTLKVKAMQLEKQESIVEVDAIYQAKPNRKDIERLQTYKKIWCKNCEEPKFVVENIRINTKDIKYSSGAMRFFVNGTRFIKWGVTKEEVDSITSHNDIIVMNVLGKIDIVNIYGKDYVEVNMNDYQIINKEDTIGYSYIDYSEFF